MEQSWEQLPAGMLSGPEAKGSFEQRLLLQRNLQNFKEQLLFSNPTAGAPHLALTLGF